MVQWIQAIVLGVVIFVVAVLCAIGKIIVRKEKKSSRTTGPKENHIPHPNA
jgi:hypothetical protein